MEISVNFSSTTSRNYKVYIDALTNLVCKGKVAIVTNESIANLHLEWLRERISADELHVIIIPEGETHKNLASIEAILLRLMELRFDRNSTLIAFGGGIVGDMTGFSAAIFQRGVDFIQIPTTLLAQVDASVGGKTGVNTSYGKNLIGAFHQPLAVYCESRFLETLPKREFSAGIAEIIKMAVTFDEEFFKFLESCDLDEVNDLRKAIAKSIKIKAKVVEEDEKEAGVRSVLNYGHTFGHVVENKTNYTQFLHGEAVAIGMRMANALAFEMGLIEKKEENRIKDLLAKYSLLFRYEVKEPEDFYETFFLDKKSRDKKITFILPKGIGKYAIMQNISKKKVLNMLSKFDK
ncbi:MAG: 3-dehydroquinate synthase [Campylobacteraceae bacterium]|nr:3-dehydroquinate synthase [Campylobacteraceae bacterium]